MKRSTIIIVFIFAALLVFTTLWQKNKAGKDSTPTASATPVNYLLVFDTESLQELQITTFQGRSITLRRDEAGVWAILEYPDQPADMTKVQTVIDQLATLNILSTLDSAPVAEVIGLDQPAYTIKFSLRDGVTKKVIVGDLTPTKSGYYVRIDGESSTHIVTKFNLDSLTKILDNPPLPSTPTPEAESIPTPLP